MLGFRHDVINCILIKSFFFIIFRCNNVIENYNLKIAKLNCRNYIYIYIYNFEYLLCFCF